MGGSKAMKSITYEKCKHSKIRHSPDGFNLIEECFDCMKAWHIAGITSEVTLLPTSWMVRVSREQETLIRIDELC